MKRSRIVPIASLMAVMTVGCGSGPTLVPVEGTVTLNGEPLEGAEITFVPGPNNKEVTPGVDSTGPDGNYMAMYRQQTGLAPGSYKVLISKKAELEGAAANAPPEIMGDPAQAAMAGYMQETLPEKYTDPLSSDFSIEVTDQGGTFDFDVKAATEGS